MLLDRLYKPADDATVFHYCSAPTFHAIATNGSIRFTDINMLNDESECKLAYSVFEEAATEIIKRNDTKKNSPAIDLTFIDSIDAIISESQFVAHPFIACFSLKPDLLGQWRAYADDGKGFAVGFNVVSLMQQLPAIFLKVLYDREQQVKEMIQAIESIHMKRHNENDFITSCISLATYMTAFKSPSFAEEQEIRAVHPICVEQQGHLFKFVDRTGIIDKNTEGNPVSFQVRENHLVAYMDAMLSPERRSSPISQLVLGPKNHSHFNNLCFFLGGLGYEHSIKMQNSSVPYR